MNASIAVKADGRFVRKSLFKMGRYGRYLGPGSIEVNDLAVLIHGKRVYNFWVRCVIAILIGVIIAIIWTAFHGPGFVAAMIVSPFITAIGVGCIWVVVDYGTLKRENIEVPLLNVTGVAVNVRKQLVAIRFKGHRRCSPVVLQSSDFMKVADKLQPKIRHAESA